MKSVTSEEEDILYNLNKDASKRGRKVCSLRASEVIDFSSQYGSNACISYTAQNLTGPPTIYPRTGDNAYSYQMRTYGDWWQILPSCRKSKFFLPANIAVESQDFIEFLVETKVTPYLIRIYEILNPGAIVKFLCYCYETAKWITLWKGKPQHLPPNESNCFTADIRGKEILTDYYRIEFYHKHLDYFYEIDGIILYGETRITDGFDTFYALLPPDTQSLSEQTNTLVNDMVETSIVDSQKSAFEILPSEVMHLILNYLDLQTLCITSRVSRLFHKLCCDPVLYKDLNLQLYWHLVDKKALQSLTPRLCSLKNLNLAWCGGQGRITSSYFVTFLESSCKFLTSLKLGNCPFVNNSCLQAIASCCPALKALELQSCRAKGLNSTGFKFIAEMSNLTYLDLYRTKIDRNSLILIIKALKLEHLFLGGCSNINDTNNEIEKAIGTCLKDTIKTLDLWRMKNLTCVGASALAENCRGLLEIDLGWCHNIDASCGCIRQLIMHSPKLKKLFLTAIRSVSSSDINAIASHCPELEQLDILGTNEVTVESVNNLLKCCKKLKLLDISYCKGLANSISDIETNFPHVNVKCSSPTNFEY